MKIKSLSDRLTRALELAIRARVSLDLFVFTKLQVSRAPHEAVLEDYWAYFEHSQGAFERDFINRISNLFTRKSDTDNLPCLLEELKDLRVVDAALATVLENRLASANNIRKAIKLLRDKTSAHQDDALSKVDVYRKAQVTINQMTELSDLALDVANALAATYNVPRGNPYVEPRAALERLLTDLG